MNESSQNIIVNLDESQTVIKLSEILKTFQSEIFLKKIYRGMLYEVNLKSILGLINIHLTNGDKVEVRAVGEDAQKALEAVVEYLT